MESLALPDDVDMDFIRFPNRINMPTVRLYERVWCPKDPAKRETFECFPKGTIISFQIFLLRERENSWENKIQIPGRAPTKEELTTCFATIGAHIGLSPWGSDKGYGRFEMVDKS